MIYGSGILLRGSGCNESICMDLILQNLFGCRYGSISVEKKRCELRERLFDENMCQTFLTK